MRNPAAHPHEQLDYVGFAELVISPSGRAAFSCRANGVVFDLVRCEGLTAATRTVVDRLVPVLADLELGQSAGRLVTITAPASSVRTCLVEIGRYRPLTKRGYADLGELSALVGSPRMAYP